MAADANETTATATVVRITDKQVRLRLDEASGGREVTKRVAVPADARERLEGTDFPVTLHGSGARARVELADDWYAAPKTTRRGRGGAKAKATDEAPKSDAPADATPADASEATDDAKPTRKRTRGGAKPATATAQAAEAAKDDAPPKRRRRGAKPAADEAAPAPATPPVADARAADEDAAEAKPSSRRRRGGRGRGSAASSEDAPAAATPATPPPPVIDPALVRERIDAAVELVRSAHRTAA